MTVPKEYFSKENFWSTILKSSVLSLIGLLAIKALMFSFILHEVFDGDIDGFLLHMRTQPIKLALVFLAFYVVGTIFLFPTTVLLTAMAFSFTHIYGPLNGLIFTFFWNAICTYISYTFVFIVARHLFGDFVYSRMIRFEKFFTFDRAIRKKGAQILFIIRFSFLIPNTIINYACAVTDLTIC